MTPSLATGPVGSGHAVSDTDQLRHTQGLTQALIDHLPELLYAKDRAGRFTIANRALSIQFGLEDPADVIGKNDFDLFPAEIAEEFAAAEQLRMASDDPFHYKAERQNQPGEPDRWTLTTKVPIHDAAGDVIGLVGSARDITAQRAAEQASRLRDRAINALDVGVTIVDPTDPAFPIIDVNDGFERLTGYSRAEVLGRSAAFMRGPETDPDATARLDGASARGGDTAGRVLNYRKDGTPFWNEVRLFAVRDDDGNHTHTVGILTDVTEQVRVEQELRFQREVHEQAIAGVIATDTDGRITHWNRHAETMYGWSAADAIGRVITDVLPVEDSDRVIGTLRRTLLEGRAWTGVRTITCKDGSPIHVRTNNSALLDAAGVPVGIVGVSIDIGEQKALEDQLLRLAYHDTLTGLANRAYFLERLTDTADRATRGGPPAAVLFLDLDRFKIVNDSLGHDAGDQVLMEVAFRLRRCVRPTDTLARFGGDEFAVLLDGVSNLAEAASVADRIIAALQTPFALGEREAFLGASVGVALVADEMADAGEILRMADVALYEAKGAGRGRWTAFDDAVGGRVAKRLETEAALRHGLARGEFVLHYQPVIELQTGYIYGFEALVRWRHPTRGLLFPVDFIPLADETGLIVALGEWVLLAACQQGAAWQALRPDDPPVVAVNVSPQQFRTPALGHHLWAALGQTGLAPGRLKLEVTEQALADHTDAAALFLRSLKTLGVQLALDDFGTGYSSLGRLHTLPLDAVKIDRSFIQELGNDQHGAAIVRAVATLGHELGLSVTAEGIETEEQRRMAAELGCDRGQGFLFARPVPAAEATQLLLAGPLGLDLREVVAG